MIFRNRVVELRLVEKLRLFALPADPSWLALAAIRVSKMESLFAACLNGLLQQNRHKADVTVALADVRCCCKTPKMTGSDFLRQSPTDASSSPSPEVAGEFITSCCGPPPRDYSIAAPTARKFVVGDSVMGNRA
jgi:hypothetical protein